MGESVSVAGCVCGDAVQCGRVFVGRGVLPGEREWPISATFVSVLTPEEIVSFPRGARNWSEMERDRQEPGGGLV